MKREIALGLCPFLTARIGDVRIERIENNPDLDFRIYHSGMISDDKLGEWVSEYFRGKGVTVTLDKYCVVSVMVEASKRLLIMHNDTQFHRINGSFTVM